MVWLLGILLLISLGINILQFRTIRMRTMNFRKQIEVLNARFIAIMDRYELMIRFVDGIVNNPRYAETYVKFDPIVMEVIGKIKDFQIMLANIFNVDLDDDELDNEDATIPKDLQGEIEHEQNRRN